MGVGAVARLGTGVSVYDQTMPAAKKTTSTMRIKSSGGIRHVKTLSGGVITLGPEPVEVSTSDGAALVARGKAVNA